MGRISKTREETCDQTERLIVKRIGGGNITEHRPLFSKDTRTLFIATSSIVRAYSTATGEIIRDYDKLESNAVGIELHPGNPEILVACSVEGQLVEWRWKTGHHVKEVKLQAITNQKANCIQSFNLIPSKGPTGTNSYNVLLWIKHNKHTSLTPALCSGHNGEVRKSFLPEYFTAGQHRHSSVFGNCQGQEFIASVDDNALHVYRYSDGKHRRHLLGNRVFTCVSCHPWETILATGDNTGRVLIWQDFFDSYPTKSVYHWHTLPVQDVAFSHAGSFFYSGGEERVLVKWNLNDPLNRGFLPRLPATIVNLVVSPDNSFVAVSTEDNGIQLLDPHKRLTCVIQHMTWGVIKGTQSALFPVGIVFDPRTKGIVLNGRCGHLQFYSPNSNTLLYNLDITGQNIVSRQRHETVVNTEVVRAAISGDGVWLATVEERNDGESSLESRLKFWCYCNTEQTYMLNTSFERPHNGCIRAIKFQPVSAVGPLMVVTAGEDCKFRSWSLVSANSIYRTGELWQCESVGFFKKLPVGDVGFSSDGSLLGVAFDSTLTVWIPETVELKCSLTHISVVGPINRVEFGQKSLNHLVVVASATCVAAWNLLSISILWVADVSVALLTADPILGHMAIVTSDSNLIVIRPDSPKPVYEQMNLSPNKCSIVAAVFAPRITPSPSHIADWLTSSQLYFIDSEQELLTLDSNKSSNSDGLVILPAPENIPLTPFAALMAQQSSTTVQSLMSVPRLQMGIQGASTIKEFLSAPAHTMPSLTLLCKEFLHSLVATTTGPNEEAKTATMEVDVEEESTDRSVASSRLSSTQPRSATVAESEIDLEKRLDSLLQEPMGWTEHLFAQQT